MTFSAECSFSTSLVVGVILPVYMCVCLLCDGFSCCLRVRQFRVEPVQQQQHC